MKIKEKIMLEHKGLMEHGPINIVVLGDSVSHGSFNGYINYEAVYWNLLKQKLNRFRQYVPVNMINVSVGGTTAKQALARLDKQVFLHEPDLIIVCYGLNDVNYSLEDYIHSLREIFERSLEKGFDVIFMTPNMLNTYVAEDAPAQYRDYAFTTAKMQNEGKMDAYMKEAVNLAQSMGVRVCDCYAKWKELAKTQDTTMLLANRINHPTEEMHVLFADSLYEMIMEDTNANDATEGETMIQKA